MNAPKMGEGYRLSDENGTTIAVGTIHAVHEMTDGDWLLQVATVDEELWTRLRVPMPITLKLHPRSGMLSYPKHWPWFKQRCFGSWADRCDMLVGPCACAAGHSADEWVEFLAALDTRIVDEAGKLLADGNTTPTSHCVRSYKEAYWPTPEELAKWLGYEN